MQLWFSHSSEVSLREQLVTQIKLGILSSDLVAGQRLPSTRDLARRFRIHANTVSAAYRQLEKERWLELRRGSGVYVCDRKTLDGPGEMAVDQLIGRIVRTAQQAGLPLSAVRARLRQWLELQPPDHFLLVEPDEDLRDIVAAEMRRAVKFPVYTCGLKPSTLSEHMEGAIVTVLANRVKMLQSLLPHNVEIFVIKTRSVPGSMRSWLPARPDVLVGIASGWPEFPKLARTLLVAAGFHPSSLVLRDTRRANWQRGLDQVAALVCDSLTASSEPRVAKVISFPLLSEASIKDLQQYQDFICQPFE